MLKIFKDADQVALEEVTRLTRRSIRILEDLSEFSPGSTLSETLHRHAVRRSELLAGLYRALRAQGETPADEDPERAHIQALWYTLKSAVSEGDREAVLREALEQQDAELRNAIDEARKHPIGREIEEALEALAEEAAEGPPMAET